MTTTKRVGALVALACAAALLLAACSGTPTSPTAGTNSGTETGAATPPATSNVRDLTGSATFRSDTPLPSGAKLTAAIVEQSASGAPSFAETSTDVSGKNAPLDFAIPYDVTKVDPQGLYSLQATVTATDGSPLWVSKGKVLILTQGRPSTAVAVPLEQP